MDKYFSNYDDASKINALIMANVDDLGSIFSSLIPLIVEHGPTLAEKLWNKIRGSNNASIQNDEEEEK